MTIPRDLGVTGDGEFPEPPGVSLPLRNICIVGRGMPASKWAVGGAVLTVQARVLDCNRMWCSCDR